jgi:hypothetical protein
MSLPLDQEALSILIKNIQRAPIFIQISHNNTMPLSLHLKGNPFGTNIAILQNGKQIPVGTNDFVGIAPGQARLPIGAIKIYVIPPADYSDPKEPLNYKLTPH